MVVSANRYLTQSEMLENANYIVNYLTSRGWTKESVAGMLGNMETESTINPGIWQNLYVHPDNGYGLVQWTPSTKYTNWANNQGLNPDDIDSQLKRIEYEIANGIQWISTSAYPLTFADFKVSTESPEYLAQAFLINYERPANQNQPGRSTQARYWFDNTTGEGGGSGGDGRQLAVLPIDYVNISQGEYGSFSHYDGSGQELAIDFVFPQNEYPLYAPFDIEVIERFDDFAQIVWKNTVPVMGADGTPHDELHINVVHDNHWTEWNIGDRVSKGQRMGYSGNSGQSTGDHFHLEVMKGHTHYFPARPELQLHIYDVFDTKHVTTWVDDGGYDWKESDYQDGTGGGDDGGEQPSKEGDIYYLLLSGAMVGW